MDPLSIAASVLTLADAVTKIYHFLQSIHHADAGYAGLCTELHSLTALSESIARTLQDCQQHPMALAHIDQDVWKQSRNTIGDSQQAIDDLKALVKRIGGPVRSKSIFRRTKVAMEINIHTREIVSFRDKIRMSNLGMQTLLQIINVSLSLRSNTSQTMILRELEQLNHYMDISTRATADNNPLFELDKSDAYVVQNLKNLVRAAGDFHASASIKASTISSGSHLGMDAIGEYGYAQSGFPPLATSKRRHIDMLRWRNRLPSRMNSLTPSGNFGIPPSLKHVDYPEVVVDDEAGLDPESNLDSTLSGGLSKMAQKALRKFDFAEAEKILQRALERHKISAPDDAHHSRLRTQLAICSFLQGKGSKMDEAVIDLAEFRGTKRSVACQLLYNLALSHIHDFDSEAARKICLRLWSSMSRPDVTDHLDRSDLLRLLVVSYRMSGEALYAEAIEAEHPELASLADDGLPSVLESVISCKELLVEFYGAEDNSEVPRLFIHQLRSQAELSGKSAFELSRIKQQMQREADPGRPTSKASDATGDEKHTSLRQKPSVDASDRRKSSSAGKFNRLRTILGRQHTTSGADSDTSKFSIDTRECQDGSIRKSIQSPPKEDRVKDCPKPGNEVPLWQRISPWHRRKRLMSSAQGEKPATGENGDQILAWLRGQSALKKKNVMSAIPTDSVSNSSPLHRQFSFVGMPSTPCEGSRPKASILSGKAPIAEMPDYHLIEMMETSPRAELWNAELTSVDTINKHSHFAPSDSIASRIVNSPQSNSKSLEFAEIYGTEMPKQTCRGNENYQEDRADGPICLAKDHIAFHVRDSNEESGSPLASQSRNKQSNIPDLPPNPEPVPAWRKGLCLYRRPLRSMFTGFREYNTEPKGSPSSGAPMTLPEELTCSLERLGVHLIDIQPRVVDQDSGYESGRGSQTTSTKDDGPASQSTETLRGWLRLFNHTRPTGKERRQDAGPREPRRFRAIRARLRPKPQGGGKQTFSIRRVRKIPQSGAAYEYLGPTAVPGPYTNEQDESPQSPSKFEFGVPDFPDGPGDIRVPVELDSRPINAVRYA